jgi:hypothetical protein
MICPECERLIKSKEKLWRNYEDQKNLAGTGLFKEVKSTEEIDQLLKDYKIALARLRCHLAVKHADEGHRVSEEDLRLVDGQISPTN